MFNHFEICKWLHSLGNLDLHADDSFGFRIACGKEHHAIAHWMWGVETFFEDWKRSGSLDGYDKYYERFHT